MVYAYDDPKHSNTHMIVASTHNDDDDDDGDDDMIMYIPLCVGTHDFMVMLSYDAFTIYGVIHVTIMMYYVINNDD